MLLEEEMAWYEERGLPTRSDIEAELRIMIEDGELPSEIDAEDVAEKLWNISYEKGKEVPKATVTRLLAKRTSMAKEQAKQNTKSIEERDVIISRERNREKEFVNKLVRQLTTLFPNAVHVLEELVKEDLVRKEKTRRAGGRETLGPRGFRYRESCLRKFSWLEFHLGTLEHPAHDVGASRRPEWAGYSSVVDVSSSSTGRSSRP